MAMSRLEQKIQRAVSGGRFKKDAVPLVKMRDDTHPQRYPKHGDPDKGQVWGGECNRTACGTYGATYWNMGTYGLYCRMCARMGNMRGRPPLYIAVECKPAVADMEQFKIDNDYYGACGG